jgi:fibronectin type 3 domain-containing protein
MAATTVTSSSVGLTWQPSTDNVGVTGYAVYRNGARIGTSPGNSFMDSSVAGGTTYQYTVAAFDAAGNNSAQSSPALPVTTPPSTTSNPTVLQTVGSNTNTVTLSPTAAGDTLVLGASLYTGATNNITSVTDSAGDTWHKIGSASTSGHNSDGELWYASGVPAGVTSITVTTAATSLALQAQEISHVSTVDGSSLVSNTSTAAASGPVTPSGSGELGVCLVAGHANAQTITLGSGWTAPAPQHQSAGIGIATVILGDQVTGTAALTCSGSFSTAMYWAAGLAVLK